MADRFDLDRFVRAQAGVWEQALSELRAGAKQSHWMWFVFPQIAGLGASATAQTYAIASLDEARAYLAHPVLGPRYREAVAALDALPRALGAESVLGSIDALKLRSSLTLFAEAGGGEDITAALARWCGGPDPATLRLLYA